MIKPSSGDKKAPILIAGEELSELKRMTWQMADAFGLDSRINKYQGKRAIALHSWDLECLLAVIDNALNDSNEYPDRSTSGYKALAKLYRRLQCEHHKAFGKEG